MSTSVEDNGKRASAPHWLVIKGIALTATGFLASVGMTYVCVLRNFHQLYDDDLKLAQLMPSAVYAGFFAAMLIWLFLAARFAWSNRTWLGISFSAAAFIVFALTATNVLRFAYPVCNAF